MARLIAAGERFPLIAGASSGSVCGALTVAGKAADAPDIARSLGSTPIVSTRYWGSERSIFGMGRILRDALRAYLPEASLHDTESELLIATTHAGRYARALFPRPAPHRTSKAGLVIHSNRERADLHEIIVASCYIPVLYAGISRIDGEVHVDGAVADNTLIDALVARGADDITVITPFASGAVARTMFAPESPLDVPPHVRVRVIYPERPLSIGRFDFDRGRLEEALAMPHKERWIAPETSALRRRPA